jgi:RNA polymerase sigma-54 factor
MLKQNLQLKLGQKLAPQQIQLMKLIQLHTLEFQEELERVRRKSCVRSCKRRNGDDDFSSLDNSNDYEEEGNESIDTDFDVDEYLYDDEPSYKTASSNYSADDEDFDNESLLTEGQSLYDYLMEQIRLSNIEDDDLKIAEYIIGNLDNDGYLKEIKIFGR